METTVVHNAELHRYEVRRDGAVAGFAQYELRPAAVAFVHTEIDKAFAGQGLASVLIRHALDDVRARGLAVLPFCPFVRGFIDKHRDDYLDLVPVDQRPQFDLAPRSQAS
jgi:predicted GNAT family acetyltransferase